MLLRLVAMQKVGAQRQSNVCVYRRSAKWNSINFVTLYERAKIFARNICFHDNMSLVVIPTFFDNRMYGRTFKSRSGIDHNWWVTFAQRPVIDVLDPVGLQIPTVRWERDYGV